MANKYSSTVVILATPFFIQLPDKAAVFGMGTLLSIEALCTYKCCVYVRVYVCEYKDVYLWTLAYIVNYIGLDIYVQQSYICICVCVCVCVHTEWIPLNITSHTTGPIL